MPSGCRAKRGSRESLQTMELNDFKLPAVTFCHKGLQKYSIVEIIFSRSKILIFLLMLSNHLNFKSNTTKYQSPTYTY